MSTDETQPTERPNGAYSEQKPAISDPRDDLRGQVATHRRDLLSMFSRRIMSSSARRGAKRVIPH